MLLLTFPKMNIWTWCIVLWAVMSYELSVMHHRHQSLVWHTDDLHLNIWKLNLNLWIFGLLACQFQYSFIFTVWKKSMNDLANIIVCVLRKKSDIENDMRLSNEIFFLFLGELPYTAPRTLVRFFTHIYMLLSYCTKAKHSRNPSF